MHHDAKKIEGQLMLLARHKVMDNHIKS